MKFTEHEMTTAVTAVAKAALAVQMKADDVEKAWATLDAFGRYQVISGVGEPVLPVLVALPDVTIEPGTRAEYAKATVVTTVGNVAKAEAEARGTKISMKGLPHLAARTLLVMEVLKQMPLRRDPDGLLTGSIDDEVSGFVVPDTLEGL